MRSLSLKNGLWRYASRSSIVDMLRWGQMCCEMAAISDSTAEIPDLEELWETQQGVVN